MRLMYFRWIGAMTLGGLLAAAPTAQTQEKKTDAKPASQAPPTVPAAPAPPEGRPDLRTTRVEARLKGLDRTLTLTDEQKTKIRPVLEEEVKKWEEMQQDKSIPSTERIKKFREVREATQAKIRPLLTPEQLQKLDSRLATPKRVEPAPGAPAAPAAPPAPTK